MTPTELEKLIEETKDPVKPEKKRGWVNIYSPESSDEMDRAGAYIYQSKVQADNAASRVDRIACIEIEYEEGEGL